MAKNRNNKKKTIDLLKTPLLEFLFRVPISIVVVDERQIVERARIREKNRELLERQCRERERVREKQW